MNGFIRRSAPGFRDVFHVTAMLALLALFGTTGCAGGGGEAAGPARFEPDHSPEHFRRRHQRVLRDFYGHQIRVRQKREEAMREKERKTNRWLMGQRRRIRARERMLMRNQALVRAFFRRQKRREEAMDADAARDAHLRADFLANQARFDRLREERALRDAKFNSNLLRIQSEGRQESEAQNARNRQLLLDAQARARRPRRQPRGAPLTTAQARSPAAEDGTPPSGAFLGFLRKLKAGIGTGDDKAAAQ